MKKLIPLLAIPLLLTGCIKYGSGQTTGYVYAVDDGIVWDKVWFKTSLESSQSDCYLVNNDDLKAALKAAITKKVELHYSRHLITLGTCENATEDEITDFDVLP